MRTVNIVYHDRDIIVADKPPNMLSVPGISSDESLAGTIAQMFGIERIDRCIVHRLDYATSGLMVFARNDQSLKNLHGQFRSSQDLRKVYLARVWGEMESAVGEVTVPLGADRERGGPYRKVDVINGKESRTLWKMIDCSNGISTVELVPITGRYANHFFCSLTSMPLYHAVLSDRTHQLRLHMGHLGHYVVGDKLYNPNDPAERLMLHSSLLQIRHPVTGSMLSFSSFPPFFNH